MHKKRLPILLSLTLGLLALVGTLTLLGAWRSGIAAAHAQGGTRYVAPGGSCGSGITPCYSSVQAAVDAATFGDEIRVATGVYTDIHARQGITQVVYLSKTVTVRGGYSADFGTWNPSVYTTTLDAEGQGRVLYISGDISPTVEGLRLTGGDATGLDGSGGFPWLNDAGGGVYVITATATISGCQIYDNQAAWYGTYNGNTCGGGVYLNHSAATLTGNTISGNWANIGGGGVCLYSSDNATLSGNTVSGNDVGGVYLNHSAATLTGNTISGNRAPQGSGGGVYLDHSAATLTGNTAMNNSCWGGGGGMYLYYSDNATLSGNTVSGNEAHSSGGGLYLNHSAATLSGNTVMSNTVDSDGGGGLYLNSSAATLSGNTVMNNTAGSGGGLYLNSSAATLSGNSVMSNTAGSGGGVHLLLSDATLDNNFIADNNATSGGGGAGLRVLDSSPRLRHNTLARNTGSNGIYVVNSTVALTDTILVSHTVGIAVAAGNTATLTATLWGSGSWANTTDWGGAGSIVTGTVNIWGNPAFVDPDGGDYHIGPASAARDAGVNAGVTTDIDGEARPNNGVYDIGADEFYCYALTGATITGPTIGYTGTAHVFTATVSPPTATLPITYTWQATGQSTVTQSSTSIQVSVHFTWSTLGPQVITVTAQNCGGIVTATHTVVVIRPEIYLPLMIRNYP